MCLTELVRKTWPDLQRPVYVNCLTIRSCLSHALTVCVCAPTCLCVCSGLYIDHRS